MVAMQFAKFIGLKNPWPKMERLVSVMEAERIHEKNKEVIATLVLVLSLLNTLAITIGLYMFVTYRLSFVPLFLSVSVLGVIPLVSRIIKTEMIAILLSAVLTAIIGIAIGPLIDFDINVVPLLAFPILVLSAHIWNYFLKDLDKNIYPITQAGLNHIRMNRMLCEMNLKRNN